MSIVLDGDNLATSGIINSGTAAATTSGTYKDWAIPTGVKRVTGLLHSVSTNGTSPLLLQVGSGGSLVTSGYSGQSGALNSSTTNVFSSNYSSGVILTISPSAAYTYSGKVTIELLGSNTYIISGTVVNIGVGGPVPMFSMTSIVLSGALDKVRLTTVNGTDTFDLGSANVLYE